MTTQQLTPEEAYTWLTQIMPNCRNDEMEQIIATNRKYAYWYAANFIKGRWELGEPIIATHPNYAYFYARNVIKGRFEQGEPAIAADTFCAYWYAHNVIKGRFELGEQTIKKSLYWNDYCQHFGIKP